MITWMMTHRKSTAFFCRCYQALSSPRFWGESLGTRLVDSSLIYRSSTPPMFIVYQCRLGTILVSMVTMLLIQSAKVWLSIDGTSILSNDMVNSLSVHSGHLQHWVQPHQTSKEDSMAVCSLWPCQSALTLFCLVIKPTAGGISKVAWVPSHALTVNCIFVVRPFWHW